MKYKEICVNTTREGAELVADLLCEAGSEGISIFDSEDLYDMIKSDIIWDYVDESLLVKSETVKVKGYFGENVDVVTLIRGKLDALKEKSEFDLGSLEETVTVIDDEDWANEWRKYYRPIEIGDSVVIVPQWIDYGETDRTVVKIDPGMAFGTGAHESTNMCLKLLAESDVKGKTVSDIGTGSGILGICAARSGARHTYMYDIDDIAVKAARDNAALNGVGDNCTVDKADLLEKCGELSDIVIANITADILIELSAQISKVIKRGGEVILSGIISKRRKEVVDAYERAGFAIYKELTAGDWVALKLTYNGN